MKRILFFSLMYLCFSAAYSQTVLLEEDIAADTIVKTRGPNLRHYSHFFFSLGAPVSEAEKGAAIRYGLSNSIDFGYRYKLKVCNFYAIGIDLRMASTTYNMKQQNDKLLPDTLLNDRERLRFSYLQSGFYNRFSLKKRGNHLGNYLDLGIYGQLNYNHVHYTKNSMPDGTQVKVYTRKLDYYEPLVWGVQARLGFNRYILTATYRMSDYFKKNANFPELPRYSAGIQIGLL